MSDQNERKPKRGKEKKYSANEVTDETVIYGAFDSETAGLGGELLMLQCSIMGESRVFTGEHKLRDFVDYLGKFPSPCIWYGWHTAYDWRYIIPYLIERQFHCEFNLRTESDIYQVTFSYYESQIVMRDAAALFKPGTRLADFSRSFTPELPKMEIDIEFFDINNPEHIAYAIRDVEILTLGLPRFNALASKHFGVGLGHTAAGTAMKAWQRTIPEGVFYKTSKMDDREAYIRDSYYGGLVFLTRNDLLTSEGDKPVARTYDINSSYPYVMDTFGVPDGRVIETDDYQLGMMGIYHVKVRTPDDLVIPILPGRDARGNMRWRRGVFETKVTNRELIFAVANGYEILDIYSGLAFEETIHPFSDYIAKCKRIRKEFKGQTEEDVGKLFQNSLYGKYASRRERRSVFMPQSDEECFDAIPLGISGLWVKTDIHDGMRCRPEWAVFITAHARLRLLQTAYSVGVDRCIYGDTDSLTILDGYESAIDTGSEYGQFKLEKSWRKFRAIAPKVYSGELMNGSYIGAAKGLPRKSITDQNWLDLIESGQSSASALSLSGLVVGMKKGFAPASVLDRKSSDLSNSSNYEQLTGNRVRVKLAS